MQPTIPRTFFYACLFLSVPVLSALANPASYQCLQQEAKRTLERAHTYDPDFTISCGSTGPIYTVRSWTHRTYQGNQVVKEQRITPSGQRYGTSFNQNQLQMCGNPCR